MDKLIRRLKWENPNWFKKILLIEKIKTKKESKQKPQQELRRNLFQNIQNNYEPKRKNRFLLKLPKGFEIPSYFIQRLNKPTYDFQKYAWENIEIKILDCIGVPIASNFIEITNEIMTKKSLNYFNFSIKMLDPVGVTIETWEISNAQFLKIDFGECDYSKDEFSNITLLIKPGNCILK